MKYLLMISLLCLASCVPAPLVILSDYHSDNFTITQLNGVTARVYVHPDVDVLEFRRSFESEYGDSTRFISAFTQLLTDSLKKVMTITDSRTDSFNVIFINQSFSEERINAVKAIFDSASEDYFIGIKKVTISNSTTVNAPHYIPPTMVTTPRGSMPVGGGFMGGGSSEECVVSLKVEVWSVKERKKVSEFTALGRSTVIFFANGSALKSAVRYSVKNLCKYIRKNKTN
ncbi:MAG: hypothetical protein WCW40_02425 [Bacteroidota bacterium]